MDSELKDMEMIAEMADGKLVVRPSRLVYDASVAMDVFDENGNLKTPNRKVVNSELGWIYHLPSCCSEDRDRKICPDRS